MWLILLDASGSMGDPFTGSPAFEGRVRQTHAQRKIDAAKEALILHLKGLGVGTRTAIFVFRGDSEVIFDGSTLDIAGIQVALDSVEPSNGTNIAAALAAAREMITTLRDSPITRILLISDGLSDSQAAEGESRRLQDQRVVVDVVLIDPTQAGEELARRVAGDIGSVSAVTSASDLDVAVQGAADSVRTDVVAGRSAEEKLSLARASLPSQDERLSFTAAFPQEIAKGGPWQSLLLFLHLESLAKEARLRAKGAGQAKGADALSATVRGTTYVSRGTELQLTPHLAGFEFNPQSACVTWEEDIQQFEFRMKAASALSGPAIGEVEISAMGLPIARVPLSLVVRDVDDTRSLREPGISVGGVFQTVFASHAREDAGIVAACAAAYAALGIYLIVDTKALIGGQAWRPALAALLAKSDICQLFWSEPARVSKHVGEEIDHALVLQGERGTGYIRPVFWQDPHPSLPAKLNHLDFAFLDLDVLSGARKKRRVVSTRDRPLQTSASIPVTVLPLLPSISPSIANEIRADAAFAVDFIERTVGGRYYPVPTLLVDRQTVQLTRATETQDITLTSERLGALEDWSDILGAICLGIHVAQFWGGSRNEGFLHTAQKLGLDKRPAETFRHICESGPQFWFLPTRRRSASKEHEGSEGISTAWAFGATGWDEARARLFASGFPGLRADTDIIAFADAFFGTAVRLLRERARDSDDDHVEIGYSVPQSAWQRLEKSKIAPRLQKISERDGFSARATKKILMGGPISAAADAIEGAWNAAQEIVRRMSGAGPMAFLVAEVSTYGIFTPHESRTVDADLENKAREWGVPTSLFLPGTDRVLLCADALDDFRSASRKAGFDSTAARRFLRSVMVHEHFHAYAQTAPADDGRPPRGPRLREHWQSAAPVNEALAAWLEMHLARGTPEMEKRIRDYIESGPYPDWPYAGALVVENEYAKKGLKAVRVLIALLRSDPPKALAWMTTKANRVPIS